MWDLQFKTYLGRAGVHLSLDWQWKLILTGRGGKSRAKPTMRLFLGQIPHSGGGAVFGDIKFHIRALHGRDYTSQGGDKTCFGEGRWGKGFTSSFTWYIFIFLVQNRLSCKGDFFHWFRSKTPLRQNLKNSVAQDKMLSDADQPFTSCHQVFIICPPWLFCWKLRNKRKFSIWCQVQTNPNDQK